MYSSPPAALTLNSSVIVNTASGWPMPQPSTKVRGAGRSVGLPSGAPASTQRAIVWKRAKTGIGVPWRHRAPQDLFANRPRPWAHLLETHEGHRRNLAGAMAGLAALLKNRHDVLSERRCRLLGSLGPPENRIR